MSAAASARATESLAGFRPGAEGVTPPTNPEGTGGFLSDVIVEMGLVDRDTVERAVEAARQPGRLVERILLDNGDLTELELSRALGERHGLDHVDLERFDVDMQAASLINRSTALRYRAVPVAFAGDGALIVAIADPADALAINDLEVMTKSQTRRAVASGSSIESLAEQLPETGPRQPSPPSPPSEPEDPKGADDGPAPAVETKVNEVEAVTEQTGADSGPAERKPEPLEHAAASNPDAERRLEEAESKNASLETELTEFAKTYDLLREQAGQVEAERGRLQDQARETALELDRLRETLEQVIGERDRLAEQAGALEQVTSERDRLAKEAEAFGQVTRERDRLAEEAEKRSAESTSLQEQTKRAETLAEEAAERIRELEDADRRAEAARMALNELREEGEREREQSTRVERKLGEQLTGAEERIAALEGRLSRLTGVAADAKKMAEMLMDVHGEITADDSASESAVAPSKSAKRKKRPAKNGGPPDKDDRQPTDIKKPTI